MKIAKISILIIFYFTSFSCVNRENEEWSKPNTSIDIGIPKDIYKSEIPLSSLISEIQLIPLETNDSCLIGQINKILTDKNFYIVHDKDNNSIFMFDTTGNFMYRIGKVGDGPTEYTQAWDVSLDREKQEVSVLDLSGRKLIKYKYNGDYINSIRINFLFTQHEYIDSIMVANTFRSYNKHMTSIFGYELVFAQDDQKVIGKALPYNLDLKNSYNTLNPLRKFSDRVYYSDPFKNCIYEIKQTKVFPKYKIDFGKLGWDSSIDVDELTSNELRELFKEHLYFNGEYVVSENYLFLRIEGNMMPGLKIYYSLSSDSIQYGSYFNDVKKSGFSGFLFYDPKWLRYDGKFISSINPYTFVDIINDVLDSQGEFINEKEKNIIKNATEGDNPIIIVFQINDF